MPWLKGTETGDHPEGHRNSDRARDQVFLRVRSNSSASAATMGIPTVHWERHLFREHWRGTPGPWLMSGWLSGIHAQRGVDYRGGHGHKLPVGVSTPPPGVGTYPELFLEFGPGRTAQGNRLVKRPIGVNAPFRVEIGAGKTGKSAGRTRHELTYGVLGRRGFRVVLRCLARLSLGAS
jgi:hypothetical protein